MWKAAVSAVVFVLGVVFVVGVTAGEKDEDESDCDLAKVVKMHHCDLDEVVLEQGRGESLGEGCLSALLREGRVDRCLREGLLRVPRL